MRRRPFLVLCLALACAGGVVPAAAGGATLPSGRTSYRSYEDYVRAIDALAAAHPGVVRRIVLPVRSVEGREILGLEVASGVGAPDDGRPVALVVGLTHGREWASGEVALEYATDLVASRAEPRVAALLAGVRTIVVPVANPDGFIATQHGQPLRRRNCAAVAGDPPGAPCIARRGVDLNRNYGAWWGGVGASTSPDADTYRGSGPWSEPEAQAIHLLSASLPVTDVVSLHNVGGLVLRPPGFRALGQAPDEAGLRRLGDAMGAATGYRSELADELYEATGALEDWNYAAQGAYGYTIELGESDGDRSFQGRFAAHVTDQYRGMREALLLAAEQARDPAGHAVLRGRAPAGRTLRLRRRFDTLTSPICTTDLAAPGGGCATTTPAYGVPDGLELTLRVGASGRWRWEPGPSTRPFSPAGSREAWTLDCLGDDGAVLASRQLVVGRGRYADVGDACRPGGATVRRDPAAAVVRIAAVARGRARVRARVVCARSCDAQVVVRRAGRRLGGARAALVPGVARWIGVPAGAPRGRLRLVVAARDSVGTRATAARDVAAAAAR